MPPTNHAARLRQMAENQLSLSRSYKKTAPRVSAGYGRNAAALLAGAEALEKVAQLGWRPIAEAPENAWLFVGKHSYLGWVVGLNVKNIAADNQFTHYLPQPDPPQKEPKA